MTKLDEAVARLKASLAAIDSAFGAAEGIPALNALSSTQSLADIRLILDALEVRERDSAQIDAAAICDRVAADFGGVVAGPIATDFGKVIHEAMAAGAMTCAAEIRAVLSEQTQGAQP